VVTGSVGLENFLAKDGVVLVVGWLGSQAVDENGVTTCFEFALDASDLAWASFEESCSLGLGPLSVEDRLHHLEDVTFTLTHLHTVPVLYLDHLVSSSA
jgi:hypothetical protein